MTSVASRRYCVCQDLPHFLREINLSTSATATIYGKTQEICGIWSPTLATSMAMGSMIFWSVLMVNTGDVDAGATYLPMAHQWGHRPNDAQANLRESIWKVLKLHHCSDLNVALLRHHHWRIRDTTANDAGAVYLLRSSSLSGTNSLSTADAKFLENAGDFAGYDVAFVGDTDGDGFDDILIGAYGEDEMPLVSPTWFMAIKQEPSIYNWQMQYFAAKEHSISPGKPYLLPGTSTMTAIQTC